MSIASRRLLRQPKQHFTWSSVVFLWLAITAARVIAYKRSTFRMARFPFIYRPSSHHHHHHGKSLQNGEDAGRKLCLETTVPFLFRGGGGGDGQDETIVDGKASDSLVDDRVMMMVMMMQKSSVGIVNLRSSADYHDDEVQHQSNTVVSDVSNSILNAKSSIDSILSLVSDGSWSIGGFPSTSVNHDDGDDDDDDYTQENQEELYDQQAAAAETIGLHCSSLCLLIDYNAIQGTTILHRTAGIKLASLINGIRQRYSSQHGPTKMTQLKLILFCKEDDGDDEEQQQQHPNKNWNDEGAKLLVERLKTFFVMGMTTDDKDSGEEENPFENVEIVAIVEESATPKAENTLMDSHVKAMLLPATTKDPSCTEDHLLAFHSKLQSSFESMGGTGSVVYSTIGATSKST